MLTFSLFCLAQAQATVWSAVRVGVFWLFNIRTLKVEPVRDPLTFSIEGNSSSQELRSGQVLVVDGLDNRLRCQIYERAGRIVNQWECESVVLGSPALDDRAQLTIPGKLIRVFQGRLTISIPRHAGDEPPTRVRVVLEAASERVVAAVTAAELPEVRANAERQAMRALAIVVRTYLASHLRRHAAEGFDFCDSTHCQLYQGEDWSDQNTGRLSAETVLETENRVLTYHGQLVEAFFTGVCGGMTATPNEAWGERGGGAYPYASIQCRWCRHSIHYRWQRAVSAAKLFQAFRSEIDFPLTARAEIRLERWPDGFVRSVTISDGARRTDLSISKFRHTVGRRLGWDAFLSNWFSLERHGAGFIVRGRGFGHNVGLCTEGALQQAKAGRNWRTILSCYFPLAEVEARSEASKGLSRER